MTTLTFQNTAMTVINQNSKTFFTASDLGCALEYADPTKAIVKIYDRNADEFTPEMTALIEMQTNGGKQQVRIFSLRGAHLIAMFARTKVAKEFRKWVLDILDREVSTGTISPEQQQAIQSAVQQAHHRTGLHWQEIYRQIKAIFHVAKYDQLPADQFGNVMAFITNLQKIEKIQPLAPPKPAEKIFNHNIINHEAVDLAWLWFEANHMAGFIKDITPALEALGSSYAPKAHSIAYEYGRHLHDIGKLVYRLTAEADFGHNPRPMRELESHFAKPTKSVRIAKF